MKSPSVLVWVGGAAALGAALFVLYSLAFSHATDRLITPERTIQAGGIPVTVAIADTAQERERGLSGVTALQDDEGMLFIFEKDGQHSFWMKDMRFSIDIIWISRDLRVVYLTKNVAPETFPDAFTPPTPARYVLEVPAGFSEAHGIQEGSTIEL